MYGLRVYARHCVHVCIFPQNTVTCVAPNVLYHFKEKDHVNTSIYHNFDREGLITVCWAEVTIVALSRYIGEGLL